MRKFSIIVGTLLVLLTPLIAVAAPRAQLNRELAAVRAATAKYHDVQQAITDGYLPAPECAASPAGGMGYHYVHPQLSSDLTSDPLRPEVLLYAPLGNRLQLVGVEYFQPDAGQARPEVLGQPFDGPMPGHEPGMPVHYDLHAWIWQANPSGVFAPWNPNVGCTGHPAEHTKR